MTGASKLGEAIQSGKFILTAECKTPDSSDASGIIEFTKAVSGSVTAISAPESEEGVRMCSLAACSHILAAGGEPILRLVTRDMNRIALKAAMLGAASMGIKNLFCISGKHQTLTTEESAKGVYDVDPVQFLKMAKGLGADMTMGTETNPFGKQADLQAIMLGGIIDAGADFVMTRTVTDLAELSAFMGKVSGKNICVIASVEVLADESVDCAVEIVKGLRGIDGIKGIHLMTGGDAGRVLEILKKSGV